ncbi:hypothetical protein QZH41_006804 [Actinostola sp. cb2023]|nr:hypothetical protein QZH41_006804 [Actinostola sp. cb2023]
MAQRSLLESIPQVKLPLTNKTGSIYRHWYKDYRNMRGDTHDANKMPADTHAVITTGFPRYCFPPKNLSSCCDSEIDSSRGAQSSSRIGSVSSQSDSDTESSKDNPGIKKRINKKVPGMFKDESPDSEIVEFVGLRAKLYSYRTDEEKEEKRCKGIKRSVVRQTISFDNYKDCLFNGDPSESSEPNSTANSKTRPSFSAYQVETLQSVFAHKHYLGKIERNQLSTDLNMTEEQVKTWFQNKRTKIKKTMFSEVDEHYAKLLYLRDLVSGLPPEQQREYGFHGFPDAMETNDNVKDPRPESLKTVFVFSMFGFLAFMTYGAILTGVEDILSGHTVSTRHEIEDILDKDDDVFAKNERNTTRLDID